MKAYSQDITQLGVQWHFTEVTVRTLDEGDSEFMTNEEQFQQAELFSGLMQVSEGKVGYKIITSKLHTCSGVHRPRSGHLHHLPDLGSLGQVKREVCLVRAPHRRESIFRYTNWEQIDGKKPFLFDYDNNPKVSYYSVVEALQNTEAA